MRTPRITVSDTLSDRNSDGNSLRISLPSFFCDSMNFLKNSDGNISSAVIVKEDGHGILEQFRILIGKLATSMAFVPKKCFVNVFLSLISKTSTALVRRFFFRKNCTNRKSIYAPETELLPLSAKGSNRLEDIYHTFILHSFQNNAQCDENAGSTHAGTTVNRDWTLLTKLFLGLVNLSNEVNESFARLRNT